MLLFSISYNWWNSRQKNLTSFFTRAKTKAIHSSYRKCWNWIFCIYRFGSFVHSISSVVKIVANIFHMLVNFSSFNHESSCFFSLEFKKFSYRDKVPFKAKTTPQKLDENIISFLMKRETLFFHQKKSNYSNSTIVYSFEYILSFKSKAVGCDFL